MNLAKTSLLLVGSLWLAACSSTPAEPTPGPTAPQKTDAIAHVDVPTSRGDVAPAKLFVRPALDMPRTEVDVSQAVSPVDAIADEGVPTETAHTDALRIVPANVAAGSVHAIPIDSTDGEATLFLGPRVDDPTAIDAALRDVEVYDPDGVRINVRAPKKGVPENGKVPMSMVPLAGHPAGVYTVKIGTEATKTGLALDARLPQSKIVMKLVPSTLELLYGNSATFDVTLEEAGTPITGATISAHLVDPDLKDGAQVAFQEVSPGKYRATISRAFHDTDLVGAYLVDVSAEGTAPSGAKFLRTGRNGFHFGIPTARIAAIGAPHAVTDDRGQIASFEVDLTVESTSSDRLEISGLLAAKGSDGAEHAVASATYANVFDAGARRITLHFDAGQARLTRLDGTYVLRNVKLFSLGTNTLFQRTLLLGGKIDGIRLDKMVLPKTITPAMEQMISEGILAAPSPATQGSGPAD